MDERDLQIQEMRAEIKRLRRERDAAVADLGNVLPNMDKCGYCKFKNRLEDCQCLEYHGQSWEWRGVQEDKE